LVNRKQVQEGNGNHFGFVIDGQCLALALRGHPTLLTEVAMRCEAVVCCRMSPIQKADVILCLFYSDFFLKTEKKRVLKSNILTTQKIGC